MELSPQIKAVLELLSFATVIVGLPLALYQYIRSKRYETYNALDEKYLEFLKLCFDNPKLDVFDIRDEKPAKLSPHEQKQQLIAYTMLFSIFERAFVMYRDRWWTIKNWEWMIRTRQWKGWKDYMNAYCERETFRKAWADSGTTFDSSFQAFMEDKIQKATENTVSVPPKTLPRKRIKGQNPDKSG